VNPLVERAVLGLLRICQRLLPYKEDTADMLLRSLRLVIGLASAVSWELAELIAGEVRSRPAPPCASACVG
jgi:brefeldin A-resistance guanine nucleotide exchange factor 1